MKKKKIQLSRLSLQKTAISLLNTQANTQIKGGATGGLGCEVQISKGDGALSCIGHTCESWNSEMHTCWYCAEA